MDPKVDGATRAEGAHSFARSGGRGTMTDRGSRRAAVRFGAPAASLVAAAISLLALIGWALDNPILMRVFPGAPAMAPNTAVGLLLASLSLWLQANNPGRARVAASRVCASATALLGLLTLLEYARREDLGIDQLLFRDSSVTTGTSFPGRMAVVTALCFVLLGAALVLSTRRRAGMTSEILALVPGLFALVFLTGYIYGARAPEWAGRSEGMAMPTALAFLLLSAGSLLARPDQGFARMVSSDTAGGMVARRILPVALFAPILLGWLRVAGQRQGLYSDELGRALFVVSNAIVLLSVLVGTAAALTRAGEERKRTREALQKAEEQYRLLFENSPQPMWVVDRETLCYLAVNDAAVEHYGYSRDEFLSMNIEQLRPREDVSKVLRAIPQEGAGLEKMGTWRHLKRDGTVIHVEITTHTMSFAGRSTWLVMAYDITDRLRAEEALRKSEQQFSLAFRASPIATSLVEAETGKFWDVNDQFVRVLGYPREEVIGRTAVDVGIWATPDDRNRLREMVETKGIARDEPVRVRARSGEIRDVLGSMAPVDIGAVACVLTTFDDITERRRAEEAVRQSEERFRLLLDSTAEAIYGLDLNGLCTFSNSACARLLGYAGPDDLLGKNMHEVAHHTRPDGSPYPVTECLIFKAFRRGEEVHVDDEVLWRADGTSFSAEFWSHPIRRDGEVVGAVVTFLDISERRRDDESIRKLSRAVEQAKNAIFMTDPNGAINYVNPAFEEIYGYSRQEALGKTPRILKSGQHDRAYYERFWQRLLAGESIREEFVNKTRDGRLVTVEASISPVLDAQGKRVGFIAVQDDVTERKRVEEAHRKSEKRFSLAFHESPSPTSIVEMATGRILDVNDQFLRLLRCSREEVLGRTAAELDLWVEQADRDRRVKKILTEGAVRDEEFQVRTLSGEIRDVVGSAVRIDVGSIPSVLSTFLDITERKRAEKEIRRSEERFRRLFDSNTIGIEVADLTGRTLEANDAYLAMIGYTREDLLSGGLRWDDMTPAEYRGKDEAAVEQLRKTGVAQPWEKELIRKDGSRVPVLMGVAMLEASEGSCLVYVVDLSARRQLEERYRQAQKMEAIGQLAGGVAHDFNNLLTVILGYSDVLAAEVGAKSHLMESIGEIRKSGERAATLTRQLLAFSRRQVLEPKVLELNAIVSNLEKMLRRLIGEDVELVTVLDPAVGRVRADAGQIEQVIMNLAVNSRDAMARGGKLTIETSNVELDEAYAREHVTMLPGSYVMLAVTDTGTGMSAETKSHVFEPFFTTKGQGKGTGLGLATVYGIVKQSGGYIWLYSEVDRGTTFKVYLPRVDAKAEEAGVPPVKPSRRGTETILLVEDDPAVRALTRRLLEAKGYTVLEAGSAEAALAIVTGSERPIDLLLTDVVMPEMGGSDLAARVVALRPGIKVLYMSGYTDDAVVRHGLVANGATFLQKPFTPEKLARKVAETLASKRS